MHGQKLPEIEISKINMNRFTSVCIGRAICHLSSKPGTCPLSRNWPHIALGHGYESWIRKPWLKREAHQKRMYQDSVKKQHVPDCLRVLQHRLHQETIQQKGTNCQSESEHEVWTYLNFSLSSFFLRCWCLDWLNLWWICKFGQHDTYTGTWRAKQTSLEAPGQNRWISLDIGIYLLDSRLYKIITS